MTFFTTRLLSALMVAAIALPAAASAAQPSDTQTALVSTVGLDAAKPTDQAKLRHRIAVAANHVCALVLPGDSLTSDTYATCVSHATSDATAQVATAMNISLVASISQ